MTRARFCKVISAFFALSGCAVHPLPGDIAGPKTYDIVKHIRCEARYALAKKLINFLKSDYVPNNTRIYGSKLDPDHYRIDDLDPKKLDKDTRLIIEKYRQSAIGYDFSFDIMEKWDHGASIDFVNALNNGGEKAGIGAGVTLQRKNVRNFIIVDKLGDLLTSTSIEQYCRVDQNLSDRVQPEGGGKPHINNNEKKYDYPITGNIGLYEVFDTFFNLNEDVPLGKSSGTKDPAPIFADQLEFQTLIKASLSPSVEIKPLTQSFTIGGASLTNEASRIDVHKVQLAISMATVPDRTNEKGSKLTADGSGDAKGGVGDAKANVIRELDRQRSLDIFDALKTFRDRQNLR